MSHNGNHLYQFDHFSFDAEEMVLLREGKPLLLTPKTLKLLLVLVKNHGRIVEKEELMSEVWADSFVEDSNLTFTIRQLRKALADNAHQPTFIETIPRRGYRFIAEVRETIIDNGLQNAPEQTFYQPSGKFTDSLKIIKFFAPVIALLIIGMTVIGFWYAGVKNGNADGTILSSMFSSEKLSTNGKVHHAVVSSDGKNVVYTNEANGGKVSIWFRQLESANNVEIIPPSEDFYGGLALSPDGNFLYFTRKATKSTEKQTDIYRVSIFGGVPNKIVNETQGWISISPDGEKISFVRCYYREEENCSLWIADALDGRNEKKIVSRQPPLRIGDNRISPDGKTIAFAVGQSENQANEFGLVEVDIKSGVERDLTAQKFFNIKSLVWLPNQSDLFITASRIPSRSFLIWKVSASTGNIQPLTKDSETYSTLSLSKDASVLVSTEVKQDFHLKLYQTVNSFVAPRVLTDGYSVAFAPNGKIIFSSRMTGNNDIWSINVDGTERRQLTNDAANEFSPVVSPDSNSIFFTSNRSDEAHIWRMNSDGSNQIQITKKEGGFPLFVSPDGKWLYYHSGRQRKLWRVSTINSEEQLVFDKIKYRFGFSPDGSKFAFLEKQNDKTILIVSSLTSGELVKSFKLTQPKAEVIELEWTQNGKGLAYILADKEFRNKTLWLQLLDEETPNQIANLGDEEISELAGFAFSPEGSSFVVVQGNWKHDAVLIKGLKQ